MQLTHLRIHVPYCQLRIPYCTYITYILPYGSISIALVRSQTRSMPALQYISDVYIVFWFEV